MKVSRTSAAFLAAALVSLASVSACRRPGGADLLLGPRAGSPPPSSDGACRFDLTDDKADTVFFVLGMLDDYLGRQFVEDDDRVEGFYCNEPETARLFRRTLDRLAREQALDATIREETIQDCLPVYRSKAIADRLNSCYRYQASNERLAQGADGTYRRMASASLEMGLFMHSGHGAATERGWPDEVFYRRRALAYVSGAWRRNGRGDDFGFANSKAKANLIAQLLVALGCHGVRLESDFGLIPQTNVVHFTPTDEVTAWLHKSW